MADGGHLEQKYLAGVIFLLVFFYCGIFCISPSLDHVTGMILMFSCRKQSHLVLPCFSCHVSNSANRVASLPRIYMHTARNIYLNGWFQIVAL